MRSRNCTMEGPDNGHIQPPKGFIKQEEENTPELTKRKMKVQREEKDGRMAVSGSAKKPAASRKAALPDLSKTDLLHLLGVMEGEVQAREDIIGLLKMEKARPEALEAHYGSGVPTKPLQALQRDGLLAHSNYSTDDVYEKPMAELDRLEDKQKETYRRMLEQLLLAEKCHRRTVMELDSEKRKHTDFMNKSDDFTNLLEQERERLKRLLEQEKAYQARKDKDHSRRLEKVRAELVKLKSFALMLVDERQLHIEQIDQQSQKVQDLTQKLQEKEQRLAVVTDTAKEDGQKVLKLEAELEHRAAKFAQEHEEMTAKLANEESQSRQLRLKLAGLAHKIEELEESNKVLHKSEEDLQKLREKISKGECGDSSLMTELENLRKRVLEMEGKDEEITKTETQCRELRKKLQNEENHSKELRLEVDKLQNRMVELEKLEGAFNRSKTECSQLHTNLEKEKRVVKDLAGELETVKTRLKELECSESKFEKAEMVLKDDLMKLKSFTVILVDERKNMAERLKQEEQKSDDLSKVFKAEQGKVTEVTEKLIEESKKLLKFKSEMEIKVTTLIKEKDELKTKLASEEEKCRGLNTKLSGMKIRMDGLEETEREMQKKWANKDKNRNPDEDNKVKELTLEIERLKSRLKQLEVVEGDLMKTEDEYDLLEKKFRTEQDKANALSKLVEEMKSQIARNKAIEKGEVMSPEAELRIRCKMEEAKTRELQVDVQALKEKIHELMNKEDQLSQLQVDYSVLQQRFKEEEERKKSMSQEVVNLTKELEATKRYSRALRPSMNGRMMVNVPVTSTAVQTDVMASEPAEDETAAGFIRKSVLEENHLMSNLRQRGLKKPTVLERYPPASAELGAGKSWIPWMKKKEAITLTQTTPERSIGTSLLHPPEMTMSQKPGQPLHIRVTPDHENSTATLEITSPRAEDFFSSTTIIPTLGLQKPRITIVPKPTTVTSKSKACELTEGLDRAKSPVTITTISRAKSVDKTSGCSSDSLQSPVSIITVSTTPVAEACASSEHHNITSGRTVIKVTPEKQPGPAPYRKYNGKSNIITTEDNKIHIHLGPQFKRPSEGCSSSVLTLRSSESSKEMSTGTVLRSPHQPSMGKTAPSKMTSSITITPITSASARPTQSVPSSDVQSARSASTRIPVSKGMKPSSKAVLGVSTVTRLESRAESQSMRIELRKSTVCGSASAAGGKS
ncbi:filamin-A-interacting protein 1 isoform X1 [Siniperca chuatsi]|uniref:filamin-A-interacting protein 1 isoform X1 n=2 Tax=Siniperca chuatsi TaxID=119488 RepID=UPI001CE03088|nr:filamin-A-interacting protein 1 isoform X1 [Siniperca chuatsi]XP_044025191.1 filamin-A-interacting protein 1 isoform X1 [Siniperca chuatsi]XP_044025193.1 filamin-A-interacting protein 1 isoform X1 [Siniperca chuatsi]XP_044025194.1 filamin-A-interacting protein 1 isoform X1 [Siniperca chuatsi]